MQGVRGLNPIPYFARVWQVTYVATKHPLSLFRLLAPQRLMPPRRLKILTQKWKNLFSNSRCPSSSLMVLFPLIILQPLSLPLDCNETGSTQIHAFTVQILPMHRPEISSFLNLERGRRPLKHTLCTISPSDFPMVPISTLDTQIR